MAGKGGGGSWKVAYADFVTAMMALFLVLWITAQDQKIKEAIEHTFKHPFNPLKSPGIIPNTTSRLSPITTGEEGGTGNAPSALEMEMLHRLNDDLLKVLQQTPELVSNNSIQIEFTSRGLNISVLDRTQKPIFEANSAKLTEYGGWVFSTLAWEISRYKKFALEVEGHSDRGRFPARANYDIWELTADRANAVRRRLVDHGVSAAQISKVAGYGDTAPLPHSNPEDEINNRVTLVLAAKPGQPLQLSMAHE
jgi:chemotaxis protein MotB